MTIFQLYPTQTDKSLLLFLFISPQSTIFDFNYNIKQQLK